MRTLSVLPSSQPRRSVLVVGCLIVVAAACREPLPADRNAPEQLWAVPANVNSQAALAGDAVVFVTVSARVESRHRSNGALNWARQLEPAVAWSGGVRFVAGRVIVAAYQLHALDPTSGAPVWSYNGPDGRSGVSAPGIADDVLYVADQGGVAAALRASDGAVLWSTDLEMGLFTPAVHGDLVIYPARQYAGGVRDGLLGPGPIVALDRHTGVERWRTEVLPEVPGYGFGTGGAAAPGVVVGDRLITGALNRTVYAFRLDDGAPLWTRSDTTAAMHQYGRAPLYFGGAVTLVRSDNRIDALDPATGALVWSREASLAATPQACGSFLCMTGGWMMVLGPSGDVIWQYGGGSSNWGTRGKHVMGDDGTIYASVIRDHTNGTFEALRLPIALVP